MGWRRNRWLALWAVCGLHGCAGGDQTPCVNCPAIAGTYTVAFNSNGGSRSPGCSTLGIGNPQGSLFINQQGANLGGSSYSGFSLTGTLFDTYNFSLSGFDVDGGNSMFLQGRFVPAAADGGSIQNGLVATQYQRTQGTGTVTCSQSLPFTAQ
jgi:hypothetical protein